MPFPPAVLEENELSCADMMPDAAGNFDLKLTHNGDSELRARGVMPVHLTPAIAAVGIGDDPGVFRFQCFPFGGGAMAISSTRELPSASV